MKPAVKLFTLLVVLALATTAFAGVSGKKSVKFFEPVVIAGQEFAPGTYQLSWEGEADSVKLTVSGNDAKAVTVDAKLVTTQKAARTDATLLRANGGGARHLGEVEFSGKKVKLVVVDAQSVASGN
jgi:hypothetical protein